MSYLGQVHIAEVDKDSDSYIINYTVKLGILYGNNDERKLFIKKLHGFFIENNLASPKSICLIENKLAKHR